jgi:ankyrin repeat protein
MPGEGRRLHPHTYLLVAALLLVGALHAAATDRRLIEAAKSSNKEAIRTLLKGRAAVNTADTDGTTALHWTVRGDDLESSQLLIRAGADVKAADRYGITPLTLAAQNGDAALIELLIKSGADPNSKLPEGETVLMTASRTGKPDAINALIVHGADVNAKESRFGETALMWAAEENNAAAVHVLIDGGADKNARSDALKFPEFKFITSGMVTTALPRGAWTALMYAARQGAVDGARALADAGVDLNTPDPDGSTALVLAIINAHFDLAAMLAEKGADPNVADTTGMAALYAAVDMHTLGPMLSRPGPKVTDKLDAVDLVKVLLQHGANPNVRLKRPIIGRHHDSGDASLGEGTTPLIRAAKTVDVPIIRALLDGGADATITQKDYSTAPIVLAAGGRAGSGTTDTAIIEAIKLCLDHGVDVDAFNTNGQTALHVAVGRGADALVKFLADRGATLDLKNKQGRTPLDLALGDVGGGRGGRGGGAGGGPGRGGGPAVVRQSTAALLRELMESRKAQP